jgi:hypothetical protein
MQVKHSLPAIWTCVADQTITRLIDALRSGDLVGHGKEMANQLFIIVFHFIDRFNVPVWHDQNMGWPGRVDIPKGGALLIPVNNSPLDFTRNNLTKDASVIHVEISLRCGSANLTTDFGSIFDLWLKAGETCAGYETY